MNRCDRITRMSSLVEQLAHVRALPISFFQ
jgi:hypothetical protein